MKTFYRCSILLFVLLSLFSLAACGGNSPSANNGDSAVADPSGSSAASEAVLPAPDPSSADEDILGEWVEINDSTRSASITKNGEEYQYKDNDGEYTAIFVTGLLEVKVSDTEIADVYYDAGSNNLILSFQGSETRFKRK